MKAVILVVLLFSCKVFGALSSSDLQNFPDQQNLLTNAGFENGKAGWTASGGTFAIVNSGSNLLNGLQSATWDSSGANQTLSNIVLTIPNNLKGLAGQWGCKIMTPSGTATHVLEVYDGGSPVATANVTSSTNAVKSNVYFTFPTSGTLTARIKAIAANEPLIAIDDCTYGPTGDINGLVPSQSGNTDKALVTNGTSVSWGPRLYRHEWVRFGGAATDTNCTSDPCNIATNKNGHSDGISSVNWTSQGSYTINFSPVWSSGYQCSGNAWNQSNFMFQFMSIAQTTSAFSYQTYHGSGGITDSISQVSCDGYL